MGGAARYSLSALYRNSRSLVCNRLQVGATGTGDAGQADRRGDRMIAWDGTETSHTLTANNAGGGQRMPDKDNFNAVIEPRTAVRRLTPLECERLQGFPDGWTDIGDYTDTNGKIRKTTDSARYKALGNSIALPYWKVLARRISAQYDRDITMGSLFDGIGGFPYAFEHCGGKAVWASEIEEFPIAVTKKHFPE